MFHMSDLGQDQCLGTAKIIRLVTSVKSQQPLSLTHSRSDNRTPGLPGSDKKGYYENKVIQIYSNEQSHERRMHKPRTEQRDAKPKGW